MVLVIYHVHRCLRLQYRFEHILRQTIRIRPSRRAQTHDSTFLVSFLSIHFYCIFWYWKDALSPHIIIIVIIYNIQEKNISFEMWSDISHTFPLFFPLFHETFQGFSRYYSQKSWLFDFDFSSCSLGSLIIPATRVHRSSCDFCHLSIVYQSFSSSQVLLVVLLGGAPEDKSSILPPSPTDLTQFPSLWI